MYLYIPFPPFLVTTDHASKRVTREFRSAIEMRAEGKKRAKGKKKKRGGGETKQFRGDRHPPLPSAGMGPYFRETRG